MNSEKKKKLENSFERILDVGFCLKPYEDLSDIIDTKPVVFGTTKDEKILSIEGVDELFKSQFEQMGDMKPELDRTRIATRLSPDGNTAIIVEEITLSLSSPEEVNSIFMRASCVMEYRDNEWKLTHWHTSTPVDTENDHWHQEEWRREKEKLEKLVNQQTADLHAKNRELEIEAALERVRARSMGMHNSDELVEVVRRIDKEIKRLGIHFDTAQIITDFSDDLIDGFNDWVAVEGLDYLEKFHVPFINHPIISELFENAEKGIGFYAATYSKSEKNSLFDLLFEHSDFKRIPKERKDYILNASGWVVNTIFFKNTWLQFARYSLKDFTGQEKEIFKRFGKVFSQAYTRFLDLQRAEEQAREAQIETALERVRAQSMAMHSSDELIEVVREIGKGIHELGIPLHYSQIFTDYTHDPKTGINLWVDAEEQNYLKKFHLPYIDHFITQKFYNPLNEGLEFFGNQFSKSDKDSYFKLLFEKSDLKRIPEKRKELIFDATGWTRFTVVQDKSSLNFGRYNLDAFTDEEKEIFIRFGKVFGQAYTRFLDLQKAEEQAREAKIEASLERVRARSMSMQKTDELHDVLSVLFEQFYVLGIEPVNVFLSLFDKEKRTLTYRATGTGGSRTQGQQVVSLDSLDVWRELFEKWKNDNSDSVEVIYYEKEILPMLFGLLDETFSAMPEDERMTMDQFPEGGYTAHGYTPFGYIGFNHTRPPTSEDKAILTKFASEFSRVYQRFLDIEKAEAQARESQIQLALERVRARTMAMHNSSELGEVASVLFEQVGSLTSAPDRFNIGIINEENKYVELWITDQEGHKITTKFVAHPENSPVIAEIFKEWKSDATVNILDLHGERLENWIRYIGGEVGVPFRKNSVREHRYITSVSFSHGFIGITTHQEPDPESVQILERFAKVFQQTYTRFLDLQKAEIQAREAEIEASLERVRSKGLAMHSTDEIESATAVVFNELSRLGIDMERCGIVLLNDSSIGELWSTTLSQGSKEVIDIVTGRLDFRIHPLLQHTYRKWKEGKDFSSFTLEGDEIREYYDKLEKQPEYQFPKVADYPDQQIIQTFTFKEGGVFVFTKKELSEEEKHIFQRFTRVFAQTYTRFLDLKKAEKQAREAQIEAALERVRGRSLAMQKSDELHQVINIVAEQLTVLEIDFDSTNFIDFNEDGSWDLWISVPGQDYAPKIHVPYIDNPLMNELWEAKKQKVELYQYISSFEDKNEFFSHFFENTAGENVSEERKQFVFKGNAITVSAFPVKSPAFAINKYRDEPFTEEENEIFKRFANVFEQAYTRFLDLQKAEAQAREAKIEAALEKIRSRTMGMQSSDELPEVANLLFLEIQALGIPAWSCGYNVLAEDKRSATAWMSSEGTLQEPFKLRLYGEASFDEMRAFILSDDTMLVQELDGNALQEHYNHMKSFPDLRPTFEKIDAQGHSLPTYQINHLCKFKHGFLLFITYEPVPEAHDIFKRFTTVFEQTYTRFLDIKRAEKLALETARQSSLDRIRAEIASMRSAEDLQQITPIIWDELKTLDIPFIRCGVFIMDEENQLSHTYLSTSQGDPIAALHLPVDGISLIEHISSSWRKQEVYTIHWDEQDFREWTQSLIEKGFIDSQKKYEAGSAPQSLDLHFLPFKHGMLYIGNTEPLDRKSLDLSQSLADAFSVAYDRYEDFNKLEQAKKKIEEAFQELEAAQEQLVQQEKLASLGQLTAGIAHEIKNPLNFVNNFSDVSIELVEEAREELLSEKAKASPEQSRRGKRQKSPFEGGKDGAAGQGDDAESSVAQNLTLALKILDDIESNLRKIHEHGSRADGIVKSMLQHSRGGSGTMEPTNLNAMVREYVNLAFHGMRAGKEPINVDIQLDLEEQTGDVPLITEDFSRVILNLCNNAFDAMREKEKLTAYSRQLSEHSHQKYEPKLTVRTHKNNDTVTIEIEDNGPGIPDKIKDKILQPFFTTKKGTAGTGLGLSITHDIIKAHGGTLKIESDQDGSIFSITLNE